MLLGDNTGVGADAAVEKVTVYRRLDLYRIHVYTHIYALEYMKTTSRLSQD
jgi:hypothetical protein